MLKQLFIDSTNRNRDFLQALLTLLSRNQHFLELCESGIRCEQCRDSDRKSFFIDVRSGGQAINAIQVQQVLREQNEQGLNDQGSPAQQALNAEESNRSPLDSVTDYRSFFVSNGKLMIAEHLKTVERKVVAAALVAAENDVELAAKMLHLSVSELFDKKQTLGL